MIIKDVKEDRNAVLFLFLTGYNICVNFTS